jgi:phage protein D
MTPSPLDHADGPIHVRLTSNGQPLSDTMAITSLTVRQAVSTGSTATLVFTDDNPMLSGFPLFDSPQFAPGASINVFAGYGGHDAEIFAGLSVTKGLRIEGDKPPRLAIECIGTAPVPLPPVAGPAVLRIGYGESLMAIDARLDVQRAPYLSGHVQFPGSGLAVVGAVLELTDMGARFGGPVMITGVTHEIDDRGWTTDATFGV